MYSVCTNCISKKNFVGVKFCQYCKVTTIINIGESKRKQVVKLSSWKSLEQVLGWFNSPRFGIDCEREIFLSFVEMTEILFFAENNEGDTPLMIAEGKSYDDCIELVSLQQQSLQQQSVLRLESTTLHQQQSLEQGMIYDVCCRSQCLIKSHIMPGGRLPTCACQGLLKLQNLVPICQKYCWPVLTLRAGFKWLLNPGTSSQSEGYSSKHVANLASVKGTPACVICVVIVEG